MNRFFLALIFIIAFIYGCEGLKENTIGKKQKQLIEMDSVQIEIDEIYSLLAYSIVFKYWEGDDRNGRGYNVGCVLVDPNNQVVDWGLNHVNEAENCTQHGELRVMTSYLNNDGIYSLKDYSIYSTLEPCAMCGGMMVMTSIKRTINGQRDYYFTAAIERLAFNSEAIGGYPPYPRIVVSQDTPSMYGQLLDNAYRDYIEQGNEAIITKFLATQKAREIFEKAFESFKHFKVNNPVNKPIYEQALSFYNDLPSVPK